MAPGDGYGDWQHLILPAVSIAFMSLAINARLLRASMLDAASQRHVIWARLRGLSARQVERRHILRNATLPVVTAMGMHIGELIGGTMIIENIFAWPGVGRYAVSAIFNRDYPVIQCFTLMMVTVFVLANLAVDVLNAALDPRLRRHEEVSA
ncbi:nickel transport system permease protein NikB [Klebsiella pneumoniae]|uniref:Nickel transport system permease protein NikB n=1 Tax=Klebsiella pneumoniae TaxID=573 RepID=A0A3S4GGL8_KLEPN|nr:nickel transport system permease protein NikB [Klebsiella pneumoniae]